MPASSIVNPIEALLRLGPGSPCPASHGSLPTLALTVMMSPAFTLRLVRS